MKSFRADMHCHTTASDGTFTPRELLLEAKRVGLQGLSITDHDTIDAYQEALPIAEEIGIELIPGIEFSTVHMGSTIHILAYGFSLADPAIIDLCSYHKKRRKARFFQMLKLLEEKGFALDIEQFDLEDGTIGRPHLAKAMMDKGFVSSVKEAFKNYLGDGCSCYVPSNGVTTARTLGVIKEANALSVIAHPHLVKDRTALNDLFQMPFDGIEAYYARFDPSKEECWIKIGKERRWLITGGSDFHGATKPSIPLGASWVDEEIFSSIQARYRENCDGKLQ